IFMNVLLPEPDGPMTATNSPGAMERVTPSSARTSTSPIWYTRTRSSMRMTSVSVMTATRLRERWRPPPGALSGRPEKDRGAARRFRRSEAPPPAASGCAAYRRGGSGCLRGRQSDDHEVCGLDIPGDDLRVASVRDSRSDLDRLRISIETVRLVDRRGPQGSFSRAAGCVSSGRTELALHRGGSASRLTRLPLLCHSRFDGRRRRRLRRRRSRLLLRSKPQGRV